MLTPALFSRCCCFFSFFLARLWPLGGGAAGIGVQLRYGREAQPVPLPCLRGKDETERGSAEAALIENVFLVVIFKSRKRVRSCDVMASVACRGCTVVAKN